MNNDELSICSPFNRENPEI